MPPASQSLPRAACRGWVRWVVLLASCALSMAVAERPELPPDGSAALILDEILALESVSDAKCKATADRLEDFITGTPLTEEARLENIRLQKRWVRRLWQEASAAARQAGESQVSAQRMESLLTAAGGPTTDGLQVMAAGGESVPLEERDLAHYASVAYSLRALLAVQQESLLWSGPGLLPADQAAFDLLRRRLDVLALSALHRADVLARQAGEREISGAVLVQAWQQTPGRVAETTEAPRTRRTDGPAGSGIFGGIVEQKILSYEAYNAVPGEAQRLFLANVRHYFARYPIPEGEPLRGRLLAAIDEQLLRFVKEFLAASEGAARRAGHALMRPEDVAQELQRLTPHEVDVFEDALFFPRLPLPLRQTIESYDMDSFRDLGLHWRTIRRVLQERTPLQPEPDPFAAEALAEGIAQYGVLLLRLSGALAQQQEVVSLGPDQLVQAAEKIRRLARQHQETAAVAVADPGLVSSSGSLQPGEGLFFTDITAQVGLSFHHRSADWLQRLRRSREVSPPTFSGGGIAAEDMDGDGFADLLLLGGAGVALLRNDGQGHFEDVTEAAGIRVMGRDGLPAEARQPLLVDLDNDGLQDIVITLVNENHLVYRNLGGMRFEDVSERAGLGGAGLIAGPATALDFDQDGLLDLYIGYFGDYLAGELPRLARDNRNGLPNQLFRNLGGMRFEEVSQGTVLADTGWAQAVSHTDYDGDGLQDIILANDYGRNVVLHNLGGGRFENQAARLGLDDAAHSMNVGIADLNADGIPDFYISNIVSLVKDDRYVLPNPDTQQQFRPESLARMRVVESNKLFISTRTEKGLKYVVSSAITRGSHSTGWAWDADFFDFDNDGDDDLYCVNGANDYFIFGETRYILRDDGLMSFPYTYGRESNVFFVNQGNELQDASERSGADFVGTSRSSVYLDFDRDGDLDVVVNNFHQPAVFLRNNSEKLGHHWLRIRLVGDPSQGSNRDAIGARLLVRTPDGLQIWREVHGGTGYLSMDPKEVHIGLGTQQRAEVLIRWPNGKEQIVRDLQADRTHRIVQK